MTKITTDSNRDDSEGNDPALEARLAGWREEQHRVASQVVVVPDNDDESRPENVSFSKVTNSIRYKILPSDTDYSDKLFGGVDVSFPERDGDPAVAVYCILHGDEVVYHDHEIFDLTIPYVSSYLSFREIDPLERLVKKQMHDKPELTPYAILVDGNGILHKRRAGIACFLGVRTGLKTIGIGKTLYCQAGLSTTLVKDGIDNALQEIVRNTRNDMEFKERLGQDRSVVIDRHCIAADVREPESRTSSHAEDDVSKMDRQEHVQELAPLCEGVGIKLRGDDGKIWASALVGHGGQIRNKRSASSSGTKNPIFVSVGHLISLEDAVHICAELSKARIPEPVRQADLSGRQLLREAACINKG